MPTASGLVKEVKGFGFSVTMSDTYAAISAPGSRLVKTEASGNYTIYEEAGVVYLYSLQDLAAGKTNTFRMLTTAPLLAMTGYGQSLSFGKDNRLAIGVNDGIRSYAAGLRKITATGEETISYAGSPTPGCPFVCTDGETLLTGSSFGTYIYRMEKSLLVLFPADLPLIGQVVACAVDDDWILISGNLYHQKGKSWQLYSSFPELLSKPDYNFLDKECCCSMSEEWIAISSDKKVLIVRRPLPGA